MMLWIGLALAGGIRDEIVRPDAVGAWDHGAGTATIERWWTRFEDPALTQIVDKALVSSRDLLAASARADAARNNADGAISPFVPTISFDVNANLAPTAARGFQFGGFGSIPGAPEPPKTYWTGSAAFNGSLDIDLFLKSQQNLRASRFDQHAAAGDRDAAVLGYATRVLTGYFDLVSAKQRAGLVQNQLAAHEDLLEVMELRYASGDATATELLQQRQVVAGARAQLPLAEGSVTNLRYQLAVGLGLPPATPIPGVAETLPGAPELPDAGVPADLILNRPDLRASEFRMDAARSRKNVAVRQLLPTLRLTGQAGWQLFHETETTTQEFWGAGAQLHVPLIGGRTVPNLQASKSNEAAAVHSYTQLAANAVLEVEQALNTVQLRQAHVEAIQGQRTAADLAWQETEDAYLAGVGSYVLLLNARNNKDNAELAYLDSQRQLLQSHILLHDALGGRWPSAVPLGDR